MKLPWGNLEKRLIFFLLILFSFSSIVLFSFSTKVTLPKEKNIKVKSIELNNMDLKSVLQTLSRLTQVNMVIDNAVEGMITVAFKDEDAQDVFNGILEAGNLTARISNDVFFISQNDEVLNWSSYVASFPQLILPDSKNAMIRSLEFRDSDVKEVISSLGNLVGLNLVLSPEVNGTISFIFQDVKLQDALFAIFLSRNLSFNWVGNVLVVRQASLSPMFRKVFTFRHRKAKEFEPILYGMKTLMGTFSFDIASNSISFSDKREIVEVTEKLLESLDARASTLGITSQGEVEFFNLSKDELTLGNNVFKIKLEDAGTASPSRFMGFYLGSSENSDGVMIGEIRYDSLDVGSGTSDLIKVICKIGISLFDQKTGKPIFLKGVNKF